MVCVQKHRHRRSSFDLALADESAETDDLRKGLVSLKHADDFTIPRFLRLVGELGLKLREFLFYSIKSCFELSCCLSHALIIPRGRDRSKVVAAGVAAPERRCRKRAFIIS